MITLTALFCDGTALVTHAQHWPAAMSLARHLEALGAVVTFA